MTWISILLIWCESPSNVFLVASIPSGDAAYYFLGDVPEGFFELLVGYHINNWVQSGVRVSYPEQTGDYTFWTGAIISTDSGGEVPEKER